MLRKQNRGSGGARWGRVLAAGLGLAGLALGSCAPAFVDADNRMTTVRDCRLLAPDQIQYCERCYAENGIYEWHRATLLTNESWSCEKFFAYPRTCQYLMNEPVRAKCIDCTQRGDYFRSAFNLRYSTCEQ